MAIATAPIIIGLLLGWYWLDEQAKFFDENHTVEILSLIVLLQGAAFWFVVNGSEGWREWQIPALFILFAMREQDFDKAFTSSGLLQLRTFTKDAPWQERLLSAVIIAFLLLCLWRIARRNLPGWWRDLKNFQGYAITLLAAGILGLVGKSLDGLARKLFDFGIVIDQETSDHAGRFEETSELVAWWLLCLSVPLWHLARTGNRRQPPEQRQAGTTDL
ncbi:MAG: hypothetical protein WD185_01165 [Sneathiella sp.]